MAKANRTKVRANSEEFVQSVLAKAASPKEETQPEKGSPDAKKIEELVKDLKDKAADKMPKKY